MTGADISIEKSHDDFSYMTQIPSKTINSNFSNPTNHSEFSSENEKNIGNLTTLNKSKLKDNYYYQDNKKDQWEIQSSIP